MTTDDLIDAAASLGDRDATAAIRRAETQLGDDPRLPTLDAMRLLRVKLHEIERSLADQWLTRDFFFTHLGFPTHDPLEPPMVDALAEAYVRGFRGEITDYRASAMPVDLDPVGLTGQLALARWCGGCDALRDTHRIDDLTAAAGPGDATAQAQEQVEIALLYANAHTPNIPRDSDAGGVPDPRVTTTYRLAYMETFCAHWNDVLPDHYGWYSDAEATPAIAPLHALYGHQRGDLTPAGHTTAPAAAAPVHHGERER